MPDRIFCSTYGQPSIDSSFSSNIARSNFLNDISANPKKFMFLMKLMQGKKKKTIDEINLSVRSTENNKLSTHTSITTTTMDNFSYT